MEEEGGLQRVNIIDVARMPENMSREWKKKIKVVNIPIYNLSNIILGYTFYVSHEIFLRVMKCVGWCAFRKPLESW